MKLLFDIGSNEGSYTISNIHKYDRAVCVDASPIQTEYSKTRLPMDRCDVVNALVTNDPDAKFYLCSNSGISTASYEWIFGKGRFAPGGPQFNPRFQWAYYADAPKTTIDMLADTYGEPSFIKIDVEGYEDSVIRTMTKPYCPLAFEWSEELLDEHLKTLEYLNGVLGYSKFFIQDGDEYDFVPPPSDYMDYQKLVETMKTTFDPKRKERMGMLWCFV